jgi:rhodanese-related sulfurtransferase
MSSVVSIVKPHPDRTLRRTTPPWHILRDLAGVMLIAVATLAAGLVANRFSSRPLPMVYQTPEQRLQAELTQLIAAPAFQSLPVTMIGLGEFRSAVQNKSALILDARSAVYYRLGHVPGALNLARDDFAADYLRLRSNIDKSRDGRVLVYCSGGDCHDSKMVAQALMSLGFTNVAVFGGGWEQWTAAHLPQKPG